MISLLNLTGNYIQTTGNILSLAGKGNLFWVAASDPNQASDFIYQLQITRTYNWLNLPDECLLS